MSSQKCITPSTASSTCGIVEVEVGLVRVEAMPEVGLGHRIPGPVRLLGVDEDDARAGVLLVGVGPDVEVARGRARLGASRARWNQGCWSEVWLITSSVMTRMPRLCASAMKRFTSASVPYSGWTARVLGDVVAVVAARRGIERQQPDRVDAELGDVVELGDQAGEVADAVIVRIEERLHVQLVDDRVLVPERIGRDRQAWREYRRRGHS